MPPWATNTPAANKDLILTVEFTYDCSTDSQFIDLETAEQSSVPYPMYYTLSSTAFSQGSLVNQYIPMNFIRSPESCPTTCSYTNTGDNVSECTAYSSEECLDTNNGATDSDGEDCSYYDSLV